MSKVTLCENTFDASTWVTHEDVKDVREFLVDHFGGVWPDSAHIYLDHVAKNSDITPYDEAGINRLGKVKGHFYVVVYPEGIETIFIIIAIVVAAVAIGVSFLFRPSPNIPGANQQDSSPNNHLSDRQNTARPNERIPDIFGQLWATFDLLCLPYRTFVSNVEYEHCYMCIGRGEYDIDVDDIRDDITPLNQIDGAQAIVFGPHSSPNTPVTLPAAVVSARCIPGGVYTDPTHILYTISGGTGLTISLDIALRVFTDPGGGDVEWYYVKHINILTSGSYSVAPTITFTPHSGDTVAHATFILGAGVINIGGMTAETLYNIKQFDSVNGQILAPPNNVPTDGSSSAGPYLLMNADLTQLWINFVAPQGSYKIDNSGTQSAVNTTIEVALNPLDSTGTVIAGNQVLDTVTLSGDAKDHGQKGVTFKFTIPATGGWVGAAGVSIMATRTSNTDLTAGTSVSDQVQWRDLYLVADVGSIDLGNVTTIQSIIAPTPAALAVKERKMNALVTRKVPLLVSGAFTDFGPSKNAADIICAMALDPYIGNRQLSEVDVTGIYALAGIGGTIQEYFSVADNPTAPIEFCYTFDDAGVSFEESLADVATDIFSVAFRRGSLLTLSFEQKTANSILLFNHRNKVPKSETRTVTFGTANDNDGITLDYTDPAAPNYPNQDSSVRLYFPPDQSATNAKQITSVGIRNKEQAMILGWRLYQKLILQNTAVQFDATEEAALLVLQDRILVADNTRNDTQDGEIAFVSSLNVQTSQPVIFDGVSTYTMFLQLADGSVEAIAVTAGADVNHVVLATAPSIALVTDSDKYARTTYMVVKDSAPAKQAAFLLASKSPKDNKTYEVNAVNYDDNYYVHDLDFS